jgi:hypothetical protein
MRLALLLLLLSVTPALAIEQIGLNTTGTAMLSTTLTNYGNIMGGNGVDVSETDVQCLASSQIIIDELCWELGTTPLGGTTRTATIRDNGATDTSIQVVMNPGDVLKCDTGSVTIAAGETAGIIFTLTNSPTSASTSKWRVRFHTANDSTSIYCGGMTDLTMSNGATLYHWLNGHQAQIETTEFNTQFLAGGTCTVKNLYARVYRSPGVGESRVFNVSDNGTVPGSPITCSVSGACATPCSCNDTSNSFATTLGESITLQDVASAGAAVSNGNFGITLECARNGEYVIATSARDAFNTAATEYGHIEGSAFTFSATESDHDMPTAAKMRIRKLVGEMAGAAGGFGAYILTVRDAAVNTELAVTMTDATTPYSDAAAGRIYPVNEDDLTIKVGPSGGPSGTPIGHYSILVRDRTYRRRW